MYFSFCTVNLTTLVWQQFIESSADLASTTFAICAQSFSSREVSSHTHHAERMNAMYTIWVRSGAKPTSTLISLLTLVQAHWLRYKDIGIHLGRVHEEAKLRLACLKVRSTGLVRVALHRSRWSHRWVDKCCDQVVSFCWEMVSSREWMKGRRRLTQPPSHNLWPARRTLLRCPAGSDTCTANSGDNSGNTVEMFFRRHTPWMVSFTLTKVPTTI